MPNTPRLSAIKIKIQGKYLGGKKFQRPIAWGKELLK